MRRRWISQLKAKTHTGMLLEEFTAAARVVYGLVGRGTGLASLPWVGHGLERRECC